MIPKNDSINVDRPGLAGNLPEKVDVQQQVQESGVRQGGERGVKGDEEALGGEFGG